MARTGEVRVTWRDHRVNVNNRRKDSTRELTALVEAAEAEALEPRPTQLRQAAAEQVPLPMGPAPPPGDRPRPVRTIADRVKSHIGDTPADPEGWRPYSSREIAAELGLTSTDVAIWTNYALRRGTLEARRMTPGVRGSHITHIRFLEDRATAPEARSSAIPAEGGGGDRWRRRDLSAWTGPNRPRTPNRRGSSPSLPWRGMRVPSNRPAWLTTGWSRPTCRTRTASNS